MFNVNDRVRKTIFVQAP